MTITRELGDIRHGVETPVFKDALQIVVEKQLAGKRIAIVAQVFGANLPNPQEFELFFRFK